MYTRLETERLIIRPITLTDDHFIYKLVNSEGWLRFIGDKHIHSFNDAQDYIKKLMESDQKMYLVLDLKATNQSIGIVTYIQRDFLEIPDFGFALLPEFERQGFAYEASSAYLSFLEKQKNIAEIAGITIPTNTSSQKLLIKLGFEFNSMITDNCEELLYFVKCLR